MNSISNPLKYPKWSSFAGSLTTETAFDVLAVAKKLKSMGKDVIELQIGDSPFSSTSHAIRAGMDAIQNGHTRYCPSLGLPSFRETIAKNYHKEFGVSIGPENVVIGIGAKVFETYFCELFIEKGDEVLLFNPAFPTFEPNIIRRGGIPVHSSLRQENDFRPNLDDVHRFINHSTNPKAIFLNSPHNPTGGVATLDDLQQIANMVRGKNIAVFSDEPYCHMVWRGKHQTILSQQDMLEHTLACYTFSKSYSMSGWRLGYAISSQRNIEMIGKMINTSISCVPPMIQLGGQAALLEDAAERDRQMAEFRKKVTILVSEFAKIPEVKIIDPAGTFYVFPNVSAICNRLKIRSHGLAMFLLEAADDHKGVACLGGECFGAAGQGFIRFSCAEPDDRLKQAVDFFQQAIKSEDRISKYLEQNPKYRLQ